MPAAASICLVSTESRILAEWFGAIRILEYYHAPYDQGENEASIALNQLFYGDTIVDSICNRGAAGMDTRRDVIAILVRTEAQRTLL